jgi:hypothetical protein
VTYTGRPNYGSDVPTHTPNQITLVCSEWYTGPIDIWQYFGRILAYNSLISGIYLGIGDLGNKVKLSSVVESVLKDSPPTIERRPFFSTSHILGFLTDTNAKTGITPTGTNIKTIKAYEEPDRTEHKPWEPL